MGTLRTRPHARLFLLLVGVGVVAAPLARAADEELDYGLAAREVGRVTFEGNHAWTDEELTGVLALEGAPWYAPWRPDRYRLDTLEQGIDAIRRRYRANGYREVSVQLVEPVESGNEDELRIRIDEGERTVVDRVIFTGTDPLTPEDLLGLLRYRPGAAAPFREANLGGDLYRVTEAYVSRGHLAAVVRNQLSETDSIVIRYDIDAGPVYRIGEVRVQGTDRVKEEFVRRELVVAEGRPFVSRDQTESEVRLLQTGWFRDVSFQAVDLDPDSATANLVVNVLERPTGFWELGLGTGSKDRVRFVGAWGQNNLFGTGKGLTLRGRVFGIYDVGVDEPNRNQLYWDHEEELVYRHPHILGTRRTITGRLFAEVESRPSSGLQVNQVGLTASTPLYSRRTRLLETEFSVKRTRKESLSDALTFDNSRAITSSVALVYRRDFRDDMFNPRSGHYYELFGETAGGPLLLGDNAFNKLLGRAVRVRSFGEATVALRLEAGWIRAWHTSADIWGSAAGVPIEERYFAGGSNTVRGYRESSLGPRLSQDDATLVQDPQFLTDRLSGGGTALLLASAELRFPIIPQWNIGGEVFFDSGNVWTDWSQVSADDFQLVGDVVDDEATQAFRTSFGIGITYRTVVGPLRLDYGIPLRRATFNSRNDQGEIIGTERDPRQVWHFSLGHAF